MFIGYRRQPNQYPHSADRKTDQRQEYHGRWNCSAKQDKSSARSAMIGGSSAGIRTTVILGIPTKNAYNADQ